MSHSNQVKPIVVPKLAESVVNATIAKWIKKPGDSVQLYEPICELITDKVTAELPSTEEGVIEEILVEEGQTVDVGAPVCTIKTKGGYAEEQAIDFSENPSETAVPSGDTSMRGRYSPAVQRLAQEHRVSLEHIQGTGTGGRITRKDVLQFVQSGGAAASAAQSNAVQGSSVAQPQEELSVPVRRSGLHLTPAPAFQLDADAELKGKGEYLIDVTPIRTSIATRMRQSVTEIPHAWTMIEVDVTNIVMLRNKLKEEFVQNEGVNLTYLAFLIKAVVNAIKDYPIMNSVWAVDKIIVKRDINISLAVGTEDAVFVPVIKNADQKNIAGLAREIDTLTKKARSGKLSPTDVEGGTFTVNNTGSFGSIMSQPIINYPQAANLTFEAIVKKPVVINDMIAVRHMANICLSLDHRILDGVICGRFLQRVKDNVEAYGPDTKLY
ncbi:dihydrolipoamide acetyltransferase family protein [Marinicrinis lubricantis]|uniref:Dihydrolipoamide acetyltransferase component of pyruvate dehydrogenase complex n=1 Tax=Marinicrinis lubricantis TaxID=2086470 RepID=A0ABW1ISF5_9BACL